MEQVHDDGERVTVTTTREEVNALASVLLEALDGGYAIPAEIWGDLTGVSRERARALLDDLIAIQRQ